MVRKKDGSDQFMVMEKSGKRDEALALSTGKIRTDLGAHQEKDDLWHSNGERDTR
jgi:hypothetical protein